MRGNYHRIYLRGPQEIALKEQAERTGVSVDDIIKLRIDNENTDNQSFQNQIADLNNKINQTQLVLLRLCQLLESSLLDSAYTRGAIEAQAQKSPEAIKRAEELEIRRLKTSQKIREEVDKYL